MLLTREQVLETPPAYLKRRFENTFVIHPRLGLIHVLRMDGATFKYKQYKTLMDALRPNKVEEKIDRLSAFVVERAVPTSLGFFNTPFGAVRVADKAGRQWTWGFTPERYLLEYTTNTPDRMTKEVLAFCLFFPQQIFPQQFQNQEDIAVGHDWKLGKDNVISSKMRKAVAMWRGDRNFVMQDNAKHLQDELTESWNEHWGIV